MVPSMGLVELARQRFTKAKPTPQDLRTAKPIRNPIVVATPGEDGGLVLEAPLANETIGIWGTLARWMKAPNTKKFELEPIGAFLWELFDGNNTFETISRKLRETYKMNRVESDASLSAFLEMLSRRGLITMAIRYEK